MQSGVSLGQCCLIRNSHDPSQLVRAPANCCAARIEEEGVVRLEGAPRSSAKLNTRGGGNGFGALVRQAGARKEGEQPQSASAAGLARASPRAVPPPSDPPPPTCRRTTARPMHRPRLRRTPITRYCEDSDSRCPRRPQPRGRRRRDSRGPHRAGGLQHGAQMSVNPWSHDKPFDHAAVSACPASAKPCGWDSTRLSGQAARRGRETTPKHLFQGIWHISARQGSDDETARILTICTRLGIARGFHRAETSRDLADSMLPGCA
jgi:hypothetical protein